MSDAYFTERISVMLDLLNNRIVKRIVKSDFQIQIAPCAYADSVKTPLKNANWEKFCGTWAGEQNDSHYLFRFKVAVPERGKYRLRFATQHNRWNWDDCDNPQMLVFIDNAAVQALDFAHHCADIEKGEHEILLYAYSGMWINEVSADDKRSFLLDVFLEEIDEDAQRLYFDLKIPFETMLLYDENSFLRVKTRAVLNDTLNFLDFSEEQSFRRSVAAATAYFREHYYKENRHFEGTAVCVGHSHIDVGWLWTARQAKEKAVRTFATAVKLMEKYPEYTFFADQPVLYEYVRDTFPEMYEKIRRFIGEGRWEADGGMWLESDVNMPSGESLIRQIALGKSFFAKEFGMDSKILWLPDDFGFPASLPKIMKICGIDTVCTQKLTLNDTNKMPHDSFMWRGIDGSEVFCYFLTAQDVPLHDGKGNRKSHTTYSSTVTPSQILGAWEGFADKQLSDEVLIAYGFGDGGGGPNEEQILSLRRTETGVEGLPKTRHGSVSAFLADRKTEAKNSKRCAVWSGEMYFEYHRGVYTSVARNKKNNRKAEFAIHDAEWLATMAWAISGADYPKDKLDECWKKILDYQFHDVLPGSAIKEVYEDTDKGYKEVFKTLNDIKTRAIEKISVKTGRKDIVFNPTSFERTVNCYKWGRCQILQIPPYGFVCGKGKNAENKVCLGEDFIENKFLCVSFDERKNIVSVFDKRVEREIVPKGKFVNRLVVYEDLPNAFDAWEIRPYYEEKFFLLEGLDGCEPVEEGDKKGYRIVRKFGKSAIKQKIMLSEDSARIDFETQVEWHETHALLKAEFDLDINAKTSVADIQFGNIERSLHRNTSWDEAKFEVCAHKYFDISEGNYGAALLSDCKYGYSAKEKFMSISLLRAPQHPYKNADEGLHEFTYCLYPHLGNTAQSDILKQAYWLNDPIIRYGETGIKDTALQYSFVKCDNEHVVIETVKLSEDGNSIVLRAYESGNGRERAVISAGCKVLGVKLCDALERTVCDLSSEENKFTYVFKPFETATFKIFIKREMAK